MVPTDDASWLEGPPVLDNPTEAAILRAEQQQEDAARDVALWRAVGLLAARCPGRFGRPAGRCPAQVTAAETSAHSL